MTTMTPIVSPDVTPRLGPTPIQIPILQTYVLGDFMRAFGAEERAITLAQNGYMNEDFRGVSITGVDQSGQPIERADLIFKDVLRDRVITVDTSSNVSITEQLSKRLATAILYSTTKMKQRGLALRFTYLFSAKGNANFEATLAKYGLKPGEPLDPAPGMALRDIYTLTHGSTGAVITHSSAYTIKK